MSIETLEAKVDELLNIVRAGPGRPDVPVVLGAEKAYDRPVLDKDQVVLDGKTVNADGSIWTVSTYGPSKGQPLHYFFGYISPKKTPEIWQFARDHFSPENYAEWNRGWERNPYGVYKADIREQIVNGSANFMVFSYVYGQPAMIHAQ